MKLNRSFFNRDTNVVARELLGKKIVRVLNNGEKIEAIIAETEAYHGFDDKASHASRKKTERNKIMFDKPGLIYVYLVYGMHWCLNFTTMPEGFPAAVLIRSVVADNSKCKNKNVKSQLKIQKFEHYLKIKNYKIKNFGGEGFIAINGPGKVTKFLGLGKEFYGEDLTKGKRIWVETVGAENFLPVQKDDIIASKRIGIDYADECKDWKWNYKIDL